ncbi:hypothetical protein Patl1_15370 [Pistacia atlantica]|uniref:Uncharacterized protein n=1 Tax=Pistacia atlantica TaxID=434234 RepID=A0ACC1B8W1_9ROSI|nr:hypothetical protein Patl1_15370 [Pistacia atlantica]
MGKSIILYGFVTAEQPKAIKQFLEQILGKGVVTDVGVQQNKGSRAYAIVHFTSNEAADTIKSLADEHLWYRNSYLKARDMGEGHRIYDVQLHFDVPHQTFFRDDTDVQWVHEVDFTQSSCIGQSTALCLELRTTNYLSNFQKDFAYYKETKGKLIVERGSTSSCHSDHVPIMVEPCRRNIAFRHYFTQNNVALNLDNRFEPLQWLRKEYQKYSMAARPPMLPAINLSLGLVYMCRVLVIPCKVYFFSPEVVLSNNVLCTYPDDEKGWVIIRNVAKYSARLSQSFSSSREAVDVDSNEIEIQYGRYKGVIVVDPTSPVKLSMRPNHQPELSNNSSALLSGRVSSQSRILEQRVIVAKNPCLHPRDVHKLKVVNVLALHHMDGDLIPCRMYPPMDYTSAPPKILDNEVKIEIRVLSRQCVGNVFSLQWQCTSITVNFSKTGVKDLMPKMGILKSFTADEARHFYDLDMEVEGFKDYIDDAFYYKSEYDYRLGNLMDYFGISTEGEILKSRIMKMVKSFSKKRDLEGIKLAVKSLTREAREWFNKKANESDGPKKVYMKALAQYYVTYHPSFWGRYNEGLNHKHFLSFPWYVHDKLLKIKGDRQSIMKILFVS